MDEKRAEILNQIKKLQEEYKCLGHKTADGVQLEVGMTVYCVNEQGVEKFAITDGCTFDDYSLREPKSIDTYYDFDELWADKDKGIAKVIAHYSGKATKLMEDALKAKAQFDKVVQVYEKEIYSDDRT